jgi:cell division protein FtsB
MMRWLILLLIVLLVVMQYKLWLDRDGLPQVEHLRHEITAHQLQDQELQKQNDQLRAEVKDLKEGLDAAQERARSELGMVKQHEEYTQIVQQKSSTL